MLCDSQYLQYPRIADTTCCSGIISDRGMKATLDDVAVWNSMIPPPQYQSCPIRERARNRVRASGKGKAVIIATMLGACNSRIGGEVSEARNCRGMSAGETVEVEDSFGPRRVRACISNSPTSGRALNLVGTLLLLRLPAPAPILLLSPTLVSNQQSSIDLHLPKLHLISRRHCGLADHAAQDCRTCDTPSKTFCICKLLDPPPL